MRSPRGERYSRNPGEPQLPVVIGEPPKDEV